jgi:hypothetical protein
VPSMARWHHWSYWRWMPLGHNLVQHMINRNHSSGKAGMEYIGDNQKSLTSIGSWWRNQNSEVYEQ